MSEETGEIVAVEGVSTEDSAAEGLAQADSGEGEGFEGIDGQSYERDKAQGKRHARARARPGDDEAGDDEPAPEEAPKAQWRADESIRKMMRDGETYDQAATRLYAEQRGRINSEVQRRQQYEQQTSGELTNLRAMLEPFLREQYRQRQAEQTRQLAESIPDREVDPASYQIWLQEQGIRLQLEQRQQAEQQQQEYQRQQYEHARLQQVAEVDDAWAAPLTESLQGDADFKRDFDSLTLLNEAGVRTSFPNATDDQVHEFVIGSNILQMRAWLQAGYDPIEMVRQQAGQYRNILGAAMPQPQQQNGNGNGHSATAARLERDGRRAAAAAAVSTPAQSRASGLPGGSWDPSKASEDEYVQRVLSGKHDADRYALDKHSKNDWRGTSWEGW